MHYVLAAVHMRRPDEAEKLLLIQRCLPALMDCRMYLSTALNWLSCHEEQAFAALRERDGDVAYGFSGIMNKGSLSRVCPATTCRPRNGMAVVSKVKELPKVCWLCFGAGLGYRTHHCPSG